MKQARPRGRDLSAKLWERAWRPGTLICERIGGEGPGVLEVGEALTNLEKLILIIPRMPSRVSGRLSPRGEL